jgi:Skp family chaperone for outer membrane proteins
MKAFTVVAALSIGLLTVPAFAQTAQQKPPAKPPASQTPPAPATQKPATPPAVQTSAPRPFPEGAKIAYCSLQLVFQNSKEGQASLARSQALREKKMKELQDKNTLLESNQKKAQSPTIDDAARAALEKEIARQTTEIQRLQQDAQNEVQELENDLRDTFSKRLAPIVNALATEKGLQMILVAESQMIYWADAGLDLTQEIVKRFDAAPPTKAPVPDPAGR